VKEDDVLLPIGVKRARERRRCRARLSKMIVLEVRPVPHQQGRRRWYGREVVQRLGRYLTDGKAGKEDDILLPGEYSLEGSASTSPTRDDRVEER
jgi:hypothetical protein